MVSRDVELPQFRQKALNCSMSARVRERLKGEMGVSTRHQWFHAVGYSLDDLRLHWAFPQYPNVSALHVYQKRESGMRAMFPQTEDTVSSLKRDFNQKAWKAIGGKYAHRIFGYLLPPVTGIYVITLTYTSLIPHLTHSTPHSFPPHFTHTSLTPHSHLTPHLTHSTPLPMPQDCMCFKSDYLRPVPGPQWSCGSVPPPALSWLYC